MKWELLDKAKRDAFINSVKTSGEAALFNPAMSDVRVTTLPFYKNVLLYQLTSFASIPVFSLHYLNDGPHSFYLDGTEVPLLTINRSDTLQLNAANVMAYLHFYFFAVVQPDGEMYLVQDPATYPFQDSSAMGLDDSVDFKAPNNYDILEESDGGFLIDTPLFSDGTLVRAKIRVDPTGRVMIINQRILVSDQATAIRPDAM